MAIQKFVFLDPATGQYKEQTGADSITVPNGVAPTDAINVGQVESIRSGLQTAIETEATRAAAAESAEAARAIAAEGVLTSDLAAEVARATAAEGVLTSDLASEVARATAAEGVLTTDLAAEVTRATAAELALGVRIDTEEAARIAADNAEASARAAAVSAEESRAMAAEAGLASDIAAEEAARIAAVSGEAAARAAAVSAEETRAMAAEATLTTDLAAEVTARGVAVSAEESARIAADDALDARLDTLEGDVNTVNSVRYLINELSGTASGALAAETAARIAADAALQSAIDAEATRALTSESSLNSQIFAEQQRALGSEGTLYSLIDAINGNGVGSITFAVQQEAQRAQSVENTLSNNMQSLSAALQQEVNVDRNAAINNAIAIEALDRLNGDAATLASAQAYANGIAQGLKFKESVRFAVPATMNVNGNGFVMPQGISAALGAIGAPGSGNFFEGDRILIVGDYLGNPSLSAGIYKYAGGIWVRADDMANGSDASGAYVFVEDGTVSYEGQLNSALGISYVCSARTTQDIVGVNELSFVIFQRAENLSFSNGVEKSAGGTVSVVAASTGGVYIDGNGLKIKIGDNNNLMTDEDGLKLKGSLVDGGFADGMHHHNNMMIQLSGNASVGSFVTAAGVEKTNNSSPDTLGIVASNNDAGMIRVVPVGLVSMSPVALAGLSVGETAYLDSFGALCPYSAVASGEYAIPVGKKMSPFALFVQIGQPLLKA